MIKKALLNCRAVSKELQGDDGQALVEYALILMLVALVCVGAVTQLGISVNNALNAVVGSL